MAGFSLSRGFITRSRFHPSMHSQTTPFVTPSAEWDGIAGSGFTAIPSDPVRITAKPVCRLLVPDEEVFTSELAVGVMAAANYEHTLFDNLGMEKVVFHFEGNSVEIASPSYRTIRCADNTTRTYFGWWAVLQKAPGIAGFGHRAHLYVEAVPKDPSMQRRITGPHVFRPQDHLHDHEVEVAPSRPLREGISYPSVGEALDYFRTVEAVSPRVTIVEPGEYDFQSSFVYASASAGRCLVEATAPVTIAKRSEQEKGLLRCRYPGLHFRGPNITIDTRWIGQLWMYENGPQPRYDGVSFINTGGRGEYWNGGPNVSDQTSRGAGWFTECTFDNVRNPCRGESLIRGCSFSETLWDLWTASHCVVDCVANDHDTADFNDELDALRVSYSGPGAATIEISSRADDKNRVVTLRVNGSAMYTLALERDDVQKFGFSIQDVADWLNGVEPGTTGGLVADWHAAVLDGSRRATALSPAGSNGTSFPAVAVSSSPLTIVTRFDMHADGYQAMAEENVVVWGNIATDIAGQSFFMGDRAKYSDYLVANNAFANREPNGNGLSQITKPASHVIMVHNSWSAQPVLLRNTLDAYSLISNNVAPGLSFGGGSAPAGVVVKNHIMAGGSGIGDSGESIGGDARTLFVDAENGDFTPTGELLSNVTSPALKHASSNAMRQISSAKGAVCMPV